MSRRHDLDPRADCDAGPAGQELADTGAPAGAAGGSGSVMTRPQQPLFLGRVTYRHRRVMDAARLLPVFGGALLLVPMFWGPGHGSGSGGIYLFAVWLGIILAAGVLSHHLVAPLRKDAMPERGAQDAPRGHGATETQRAARSEGTPRREATPRGDGPAQGLPADRTEPD